MALPASSEPVDHDLSSYHMNLGACHARAKGKPTGRCGLDRHRFPDSRDVCLPYRSNVVALEQQESERPRNHHFATATLSLLVGVLGLPLYFFKAMLFPFRPTAGDASRSPGRGRVCSFHRPGRGGATRAAGHADRWPQIHGDFMETTLSVLGGSYGAYKSPMVITSMQKGMFQHTTQVIAVIFYFII